MQQSSGAILSARKKQGIASLYLDYDNLFDTLEDRNIDTPEESILALLTNVVRSIRADEDADVVRCSAYADFGDLPNGTAIQQSLVRAGCRPCFVDKEVQLNASEVQVCIDASAETRDDDLVVVIAGSRQYLPLLQSLRGRGRRVKLIALTGPVVRSLAGIERLSFLHAARLLGATPGYDDSDRYEETDEQPLPARQVVEHRAIDDPVCVRTLRIVEEFFGQYDEVYLTPLLRKLSAMMVDDDPKAIISDLENYGAVWLEKRHGHPYDYTVLVVDDEHPTVVSVRDDLNRRFDDFSSAGPDGNGGTRWARSSGAEMADQD